MQNHVRQKHQAEMMVRFKDVIHVKRGPDGFFPCQYGTRRFLYPHSLQGHARKYIGKTEIAMTMMKDSIVEQSLDTDTSIESMSTEAEGESRYSLVSRTRSPSKSQLER